MILIPEEVEVYISYIISLKPRSCEVFDYRWPNPGLFFKCCCNVCVAFVNALGY